MVYWVIVILCIVAVCVTLKENKEKDKAQAKAFEEKRVLEEKRILEKEKLKKQAIEKEKRKIEKYNKAKEELKDKYIAIMIENPEIIKMYNKILMRKQNIKNERLKSYNDNYLKILFWDFVLGHTTKSSRYATHQSELITNYIKSERLSFNDFRIDGMGGIILNSYYRENKSLKHYLKSGNFEDLRSHAVMRTSDFIHYYASVTKEFININIIASEFENNMELMEKYKNLKKERIAKEEKIDKLYAIYKEAYINNFSKKLAKGDMELIMSLIDKKKTQENYNDEKYDITSEEQLKEIIINRTSKLNDEEKIEWLGSFLENQKDINKEWKNDIIINIDNVLAKTKK